MSHEDAPLYEVVELWMKLSRFELGVKGKARTRGIAPKSVGFSGGGAEPRLTSGGEAAARGAQ